MDDARLRQFDSNSAAVDGLIDFSTEGLDLDFAQFEIPYLSSPSTSSFPPDRVEGENRQHTGSLESLSLPGTQPELEFPGTAKSSLEGDWASGHGDSTIFSGDLPTIDNLSKPPSAPPSSALSLTPSANYSVSSHTPDTTPSLSSITAEVIPSAPLPISPSADIQRCATCHQQFASTARLE